MQHWKLTRWCTYAVQKIKYPPDREKVYQELRQHLDDRCESFLTQGMDEDTAADKVWEVMGDPNEVAEYLAAIHRPFWGYAYSIAKWLCIAVAFAVFFIVLWETAPAFGYRYSQPEYQLFHPYEGTAIYDWEKELYLEPGSYFSDSGWRVTLDKTSLWLTSTGKGYLYFQLKAQTLQPWSEYPDFLNFISARDNLGREYVSPDKRMLAEGERYVSGQTFHTGAFTWVYDAQLVGFHPEGVQWVDICYERDGRTHTLRIDLTGGGTE